MAHFWFRSANDRLKGLSCDRSGPPGERAVRSGLYLQSMLVNELKDGQEIDQVLLVRQLERRPRRDGGDYLRLLLGDRTGAVPTMVWEGLEQTEALARAGEPVHVRGRYSVHPRFGPQINLRELAAAQDGQLHPERPARRPSCARRARWSATCAS